MEKKRFMPRSKIMIRKSVFLRNIFSSASHHTFLSFDQETNEFLSYLDRQQETLQKNMIEGSRALSQFLFFRFLPVFAAL